MPRSHLASRFAFVVAGACLWGSATVAPAVAAATQGATQPDIPTIQPHAYFDTSTDPPVSGITPGAPVQPLAHPVDHFQRSSSGTVQAPNAAASGSQLPDPEVLGFAQNGEVTSGAWQSDIQFNLMSTIAYFSIDVNSDGSLVTNNAGYQGYWSRQATNLFNTAHENGDMVVATFEDFSTSSIATLLQSPSYEATFVSNVVSQVVSRGVDGANIDFEPTGDGGLAQNFSSLMGQLHAAMIAAAPTSSYLSVDVYASAYQGGELYNISTLAPAVDSVDVMTYNMNGGTQPGSPINGPFNYTDTGVVNGFLSKMPADKLILGIPYYAKSYSTTTNTFGAPVQDGLVGVPYYDGVLNTFACVGQQNGAHGPVINWDSTSQTPWAYWWGPSSTGCSFSDPNTFDEMYYENAQSLEAKYALVNSDGLRGIGIWSLGMDSGSNNLWTAIATSFSVVHGPAPTLAMLPATSATTGFNVCWSPAGSTRAILWVSAGGGPWLQYANTPGQCAYFYGLQGVAYSFFVQGFDSKGNSGGGPIAGSSGEGTITVASSATESAPITSMYSVDENGGLHPASSPPLATSAYYPGWNIVRGMALDADGYGGQTLDAYGGIHAFGNAPYLQVSAYFPGFDIARAVVLNSAGTGGYILDGYGGLHPFGNAPYEVVSAYWPGWDIAVGVILQSGGTSGWIVDGYGGMHPFGGAPPVSISAYFPGQDIIVGAVLAANGVSGWTVDADGGFHPFGGASPVQTLAYAPGSLSMRGTAGTP
jgi:spore germination protein YaaH